MFFINKYTIDSHEGEKGFVNYSFNIANSKLFTYFEDESENIADYDFTSVESNLN
jgi:hypothetical protein